MISIGIILYIGDDVIVKLKLKLKIKSDVIATFQKIVDIVNLLFYFLKS